MKQTPSISKKIISLYLRQRFSEQEQLAVWEWLVSNVHVEEKNEALYALFQKMSPPYTASSHASLQKIWDQYHFPMAVRFAPPKSTRGIFTRRLLRAAAVLLVVLAVGAYFWLRSPQPLTPPVAQQIEVVVPDSLGAKTDLALADGSKVWVRSGSTVQYASNFNDPNSPAREVSLQGEAFFEVAPNARPFVVHTPHLRATVTGTSYNIEAYPNRDFSVVSLYTGSLRIETISTDSSQIQGINMVAGDKLIYNHSTQIVTVNQAAAQQEDWRSNPLVGAETTLEALFRYIEQHYHVALVLAPELNTQVRCTLYPRRNESLENLLQVVNIATGGWEYRIEGSKVVITKK